MIPQLVRLLYQYRQLMGSSTDKLGKIYCYHNSMLEELLKGLVKSFILLW